MKDINDKITGQSLTADDWNNPPAEIQNVIEKTGQTLSGGDLNQLGKGIAQYVANGDFYIDSGVADAYVLSTVGTLESPVAYTEGMRIRFKPITVNTGASTVNVDGLGVKNILLDGLPLVAGLLSLGDSFTAEYNVISNRFDITVMHHLITHSSVNYSVYFTQYSNRSASVATQDATPRGLFFKPDGLSMYMVGAANDAVYQYTLTVAWDISTATYASKSMSVTSQDTSPQGIFFKPDGLSMYMAGSSSNKVYQYTLSTAWDISTGIYASKSVSVASEDTLPSSVFIDPTGLKAFVLGDTSNTIYQYTLSTAWDISTATYASKSFSVATQETQPQGMFFKPDGRKFYIVGTGSTIYQYTMNAQWTIDIATYDDIDVNISAQGGLQSALFISTDGDRIYTLDQGKDAVFEYYSNFLAEQ